MSVTDPALDVPYDIQQHDTAPQSYRMDVRPSKLDVRDYLAQAPHGIILPPALVLPACAEPYDQLPLGACTANGICGMLKTEYLIAGKTPPDPSRLYLYYKEREMEGDVATDAGAQPRDGLLVLKNNGVPRESIWPYDITRFAQTPPATADQDAPNDKIKGFYRVPGIIGVKAALWQKHSVGVGLLVFQGMMASKNGVIPMPDAKEQPDGGHFLYIRGWQDRQDWPGGGYFILRNSWGARAGNGHGDYMLPYQYAGNTQLVWEYWMVQV